MQSPERYLRTGEVLDGIRARLNETSQDDMTLLLKIFGDLKGLDANRMSPHDAARWLAQKQTEKEKRFETFVLGVGFDRGLVRGFLIGFGACAFLALLMTHG
jgi:hypothetical protein